MLSLSNMLNRSLRFILAILYIMIFNKNIPLKILEWVGFWVWDVVVAARNG